jgi:hypothetical protein
VFKRLAHDGPKVTDEREKNKKPNVAKGFQVHAEEKSDQ